MSAEHRYRPLYDCLMHGLLRWYPQEYVSYRVEAKTERDTATAIALTRRAMDFGNHLTPIERACADRLVELIMDEVRNAQ